MPSTPRSEKVEPAEVATPTAPEERFSRDARHSTYKADPEAEEQNPPAGPQVVQELGQPKEG
jgi:hypothetical protein